MASDNEDPFDGASPNAFHLQDDEGYEDLLGSQFPTDTPDMVMPDFYEEQGRFSPISNVRVTGNVAVESNGALQPKLNMEEYKMGSPKPSMQLRNSNPIETAAAVHKESGKSELAGSETPKHAKSPSIMDREKTIVIKKEPAETSSISDAIANQTIELSDTEEELVVVKKEDDETPFSWASMPDDPISISDSEEEKDCIILHDCSFPTTKKVINLDSENEPGNVFKPNLGKSFLRKPHPRSGRTPVQIENIMRMQQQFAARALQNRDKAGPQGLCRGPQSSGDLLSGRDTEDDGDAWMSSDYNPEQDFASKFRDQKRIYKTKQRANKNTVQDDFEFRRAEKAEAARLKRLELEYLESRGPVDDSDEDEERDGGLPVTTSPRSSKRRHAATVEDGDEDDAENPKKRKQKLPHKRTQEDLEKDLEANMLAGIERYLVKERSEGDDQAGKKGEKAKKNGKAQSNPDGKMSTSKRLSKPSSKPSKKKPTQAGYLNDMGSLFTSDVFKDANANRSTENMPISSETNKTKALKAMVANLPLGDTRRSEKEHIRRATVILGKGKVKADGKGDWSLKGMKTTTSLRHHQVQGAAWMKERETGVDEPFGGILADGMGLGKTLMTIALMIANPPTRSDKSKATLIVCTPALLTQWENELDKHAEEEVISRVVRHHSGYRLSGKGAIADMQRANVVLTTYQEVAKSYPKCEFPEEVGDLGKLKEWWTQNWEEDRDLLHQANFYRVVLDESQAIKNHMTQTSIACRALMAKHRWALSATPIMNRLEELFPYFKFLRTECTGSYSEFQQSFCIEGSSDCNKRLHCLLDHIMIRRTFKDKVLGKPIVELPDNHKDTEYLDFNKVERLLYKIVSRRFIRALNKASIKGDLEGKQGYGIVMFLRLRQMAAHTFLIQENLQDMFELDSVDRLEQAALSENTDEDKPARDLIAALRRMVQAKGDPVEETPERQDGETEGGLPGELVEKLGCRLRSLKANSKFEELKNERLCHNCNNMPDEPWVTSCLHVYCKECLEFLAYEASKKNQDHTPCRECGTLFTQSQPCAGLKDLEMEDFSDLKLDLRSRKYRNGKVNMHWVAYDDQLVLSAKTIAVRTQIEKWLAAEPDKKIIVFSQFHMIMQILERICQRRGWEYCNYHGKMSHKARDQAVSAFGKKDSKIKIMIASLKCGGIGLNLTMASRVTCIDLWFNSCMEEQAFCRVFRIGQESETFATRFLINDSVDDKLEQMQKHKRQIIGAAMDDRTVTKKLSVQEVMRLFGEVKFDRKTKKPYIAMDDDEKVDAIVPPLADDVEDSIAWRK